MIQENQNVVLTAIFKNTHVNVYLINQTVGEGSVFPSLSQRK